MRTHCYEIGGDVFSLAELECCVIRGNMDRGIHLKAPFVREPKKSRAHYTYALDQIDPRINFVLVSPSYFAFICFLVPYVQSIDITIVYDFTEHW